MIKYYWNSNKSDIEYIINNMKLTDVNEITIGYKKDVKETVLRSVEESDKWFIMYHDGEPFAIGGFGGTLEYGVCIWAFTTDYIDKVPLRDHIVAFNELTDEIKKHHKDARYIHNRVWDKNHAHIKWIEFLGIELLYDHKYENKYGELFIPFITAL